VYRLWIVDRDLKPTVLSAAYLTVHEAMGSAARLMKGFGAPALDARNILMWAGKPSLVVFDPTFSVVVSAVIEGGQLVSSGDDPVPLDPDDNVGPCQTTPSISE